MLRQLIAEDTMRPARKVDNDPPQKVTDFIQNVTSTPLEDIEAPLSRFTWDYDDKGSFHHWTELFVHFNSFFSTYVSSRKDLQLSDSLLDEENSFPKGAVLQILRVFAIIFENCRNKDSFTGLEHFADLLSSNDPDILLAALHALAALVKINPAKLHLSYLPGNEVLNLHLFDLSQGWGSKRGLDLFSCVVENGCDEAASQLGSTLDFQFDSDRGLQVIHIPDLHLQPNELVLLKELIDRYQIPSESRFSLWTRIRYTRAFPSLNTRRQYSCIRLLAFRVMMQSNDNCEDLGAFFLDDPEFMNDLMRVLQSENIIPDNIRSDAIWALGYQFAVISASPMMSQVFDLPNVFSNAANHGFLLNLLQRAVMSLDTTEVYPISLIEGVLYFFLAYVTSSSTSPSPMREIGLIPAHLPLLEETTSSSTSPSPTRETELIPALLPLLEETNSSHTHLVIFAVKILQKFMDDNNPAVTLFRDLGGLDNTIKRLQIEVTRVVEFSEGSSIATSTYDDDKGQIPYTRRCLIKALLKALGSTTYAPARPPGSEESTLPSSLSLIFSNSHKFGGDIFSSAVTLMSELIHKDPTCFSTLHAAGLTTAFLDAISEDLLLPSSKALCCIPSGLDALCLNNTGLQAVTERNALQFLVHVFTLRKYLLPLNEGVVHLANSMEKLMRHAPLRGPVVDVIIEILMKVSSAGDIGSEAKDIVCDFIPMNLLSTTLQALLQLCGRLTRVHAIALIFLDGGGLVALLNLPASCLFSGFDSVASIIVRHILEDPHTLQAAMESEIRHSLVAALNRNMNGRVSACTFLSNLAPVISRDPAVFMLAAQSVCQVEVVGERPYVILSRDREKEKGKEKEKVLEKDRLGSGDKSVQSDKSPVGNLGNASIKISDVGGKMKGHKRPTHSFASVIEQLLDSVTQYSLPVTNDLGKFISSGSVTDMDVDEIPSEEKGKAVVGRDNLELDGKSSFALARAAFILKLLTEIVLMYPSAVNVILRRDAESSHPRAPLQGVASGMGHSGPLYHVLHRLLPYSVRHIKEKQVDGEWRQKLSSKASQFLMAICVRSAEGRRRLFVEIVNSFNASICTHVGGFKPPECQMVAFIDLINDVLAARSPSGSNISTEVSKTLIDVGVIQALSSALENLDLDHPECVKLANGIVKALESLTMEPVQGHEDAQHKSSSLGASGSTVHQRQNERGNEEAPSGDAIAHSQQNETESDQMESSHDAMASVQTVGNLIIESEEDFMNEGGEEDVGVVASFSIEHGGQDSLVDEDEEEEMSGDGVEEDAEDEDEEEEEEDEELDEDDVHHLSHPDADHDDHDVNELGEDYDEDDILEDEEDEDDENNFILRLEDGINVFDHFEVLGRAEGDFPSDPFHVMPIEEVFGANRRTGRTTSIYNLLGRTEDRGTAFQHPLLIGPTAPSRSMRHRVVENDRVVTESNIENTSASSHLDSIFRTLRSGRPGNRLSSWADDSQQLRGMSGTTIALGIEEQFVSQLQRSQPVDDTPSDQAHDTTISQEKGEATASQAAEDGAGMTETLQSQENDRTEEREQSHTEDNSASNTNSISTQPSQQASMEQGNQQTTGAVHHDLEMQDERNERVMRDVEAVSQDSSGSGATLGESLRSLEVEIGSADGTGNLGQIDASGNMEGVQDENSNRGPAQPEIVRESSQSVPAHTPSEQQQNTVAAESNSIDPTFLEALPEELRTEVLASQQNQVAQPTNSQPPAAEEIDPEFLAALPPDIQAEVLAQQRAQRLLQSHRFDGHPVDMDSASILATFPPELRTEVLLTSSDAVLANLPEALVTEAHRLRRRFGYDPNDDRFGPFHRGRRHLSGIGGRNVSLGSDRVGNAGSHRTVFGDKLNEADGKPLVDTAALKAMLRLLQLVQPVYKGPLQRLLFNVCTHSVTRATLVQLLLDMLIPDVEGSTQNASSSTSISSYRLYGCLGHVIYSRPQFSDGVPPLVSRRVLETLTYLAQNHPLVANLLLYLEQPDASKPQPDQRTERGKALMIDEESQPETVNKEMTANFPIVLLLKLLNQPLYSRSIAHLEQVMGLLKVIMNNVEVNVQSQSQLTDSGPKPSPQDVTTDAQVDTPGLEMTSQGSTSAAEKKVDPGTVLLNIPETELRLLSSLLACEGLSDLAYSHAADVLMKLVKVAPPHRHLFITELSNAAERLSKVAVGELQCFGEAETMLLSTQLSGAAILRVLQALSSLASSLNKEKDDEVLPDRDHDESVTIIRRLNSAVEPLWQELSLCISKIENRSSSLSTVSPSSGSNGVLPPLPPGTQKILPYIEAFFVTCEKLQPGQMTPAQLEYTSATASEVKEAASSSESSFPSRSLTAPQRKVDEKGITLMKFAERHRRLLNAFVRQNPGLLEKSLSLLLKVPRLIEFDNKRAYFRSRMRQHQDHQNYSSVRISVRRAYILEDSYNQLRMRSARDLKGRLNVNFQGEEGIDAGGLTREWYQSLSRVIFDKGALLFTTVGNEATFQPNPNSVYQTEHLSYFKFIGRVVAKALFDGQLLDVHFTRSFYKHILGVKVTYHDIEAIDPDYYKNLKWMLENDIRDMPDLTFSMDADEEKLILYEREEVTDHELIPGGRNIRVTEENKHEYVDLVAEHRLTTAIRPQINAFLEGFNELIPKNLISIFNDKELELLISGLPEIDLDDLRANTEYAGYSAASPVIQWFWEVVQSFSKEDRARLLQFVTGTSKVPLEGFKALQGISGLQRFQIHKAYGSPDRLPSAHTCFNQLDLPEYPSKEQLEERLLLAIHEASEGFGFG